MGYGILRMGKNSTLAYSLAEALSEMDLELRAQFKDYPRRTPRTGIIDINSSKFLYLRDREIREANLLRPVSGRIPASILLGSLNQAIGYLKDRQYRFVLELPNP